MPTGRTLIGSRAGKEAKRTSSRAQRWQEVVVAVLYGACCHGCFPAGVGTMMVKMVDGMGRAYGTLPAPWSYGADLALLAQFPLLHSLVLSPSGQAVLRRLAPFGLGGRLATTTYATIASVQVWLLFAFWSPSGIVWWRTSGALFDFLCCLYAAAWLLLAKAMVDAGVALQTGLLGWLAVACNVTPLYPPVPTSGLFHGAGNPSMSPSR